MKKYILFLLFFVPFCSAACICVPLVPVTKEHCEKYDVIFYGTVDSISTCNDKDRAIAYFTIKALFKGKVQKSVEVFYDCNTECLMSFSGDEAWLIYAKYSKFDKLEVSICEHSRKKAAAGAEDYYVLDAKRTFEEELKFLEDNFSIQEATDLIVVNNAGTEAGRHNDQPSNTGKIILLSISLLAMGLVYYITRRKK